MGMIPRVPVAEPKWLRHRHATPSRAQVEIGEETHHTTCELLSSENGISSIASMSDLKVPHPKMGIG